MRKLVVFRGPQGSGKSYTIDKLGLNEWTMSSDAMRSIVASPMLTSHGTMILNQDANQTVFSMMDKISEERMRRGETLVIDTTGLQIADFAGWRRKARDHRYQIAFVDLSDVSLETALARQEGRHELRKVPRVSLERFIKIMKDNPLTVDDPARETLIRGDETGSHIDALRSWFEEPVLDLSAYKSVVHIGDIQGCHTVLAGSEGPLAEGFRDDTFYIFVGDLLDRGIENGKVLRWFVDNAVGRDNVMLMHGNHEDHLHRWSRGYDPVSNEFAYRTLPQLEAEGLTPSDADKVCDMAREFLVYTHGGRKVFVNHAGLSTLPADPWRVSLEQYSRGTGNWSDDVDSQYAANVHGVFQVHGHRNEKGAAIRATSLSFNLEDSVEFGGHLRTCTLTEDGWTTRGYKNRVFRPLAARLALETINNPADNRVKVRKRYPDWIIKQEPTQKFFDADLLEQMKQHPGVMEKTSAAFPHVFSLNFTRNVFFDKAWDDVVVKARGLFLDGDTSEIVARGYDKFFNIGELESTQIEVLAETLQFPVTLYAKENGYLGNLGYDARRDVPMVASKSTPDGDFAGWFRDILAEKVSPANFERLRRYLRDTESSMTFEVIDPVNDPHIIEYDDANIVLLDVVRRGTDFRKASYDTVKEVGEYFGMDVKQRAMRLENKIQFLAWYRKAEKQGLAHTFNQKPIEGFVLEDASGFMTKWKAPYYKFWKQMRTQHQRARKMLTNSQMPKNAATAIRGQNWMTEEMIEKAVDFNGWMLDRTADTIGENIIEARKLYTADRKAALSVSRSMA
ncbi:AAA family ATPase [Rhizobium laguerreae]|uniref:RNA ligase n=1 Tax=Rhizobium laguerreae TaxID=1076926 RepID=UPI001C8FD5E0|nr:RNA ligase [Rhizobium laguerreae]MBY3151208.1 AAA family ATPase [Rhizobium laguerreae]